MDQKPLKLIMKTYPNLSRRNIHLICWHLKGIYSELNPLLSNICLYMLRFGKYYICKKCRESNFRIFFETSFGPFLEFINLRVRRGVKEDQSPDFFWENFSITKVHFGVQKGLGAGGLSIESRLFFRNVCHYQANLPFKSDFESNFFYSVSFSLSH